MAFLVWAASINNQTIRGSFIVTDTGWNGKRARLHPVVGFELLETKRGNDHLLVLGHLDVPVLFQATQDRLEFAMPTRL
jgi:hypothetical protein